MKLAVTQFFGNVIGALLLINSQHVDAFYEGIMIVSGVVIISGISRYVGWREGQEK